MRSTVRLVASLALVALFPAGAFAEHRLGVGYHYWQTLNDLEIDELSEIDDEGSSLVFSYQFLPGGLVRFEGAVEYFGEGYGGANDTAYSPQFFVLFGRNFYAGVGVGVTHSDGFADGDEWSDAWYAGRMGVELLLLPRVHLDLNANYRADAFSELQETFAEVETDAVTFGVSLRLGF